MQNIPAYYTVDKHITLFLEEDENEKMARLDKPNFEVCHYDCIAFRCSWSSSRLGSREKEGLLV